MRRIAFTAVATIVLAASAGLASAQTPKTTKVMVNTAEPKRPLLWIDQEPIIVRGKNVTITWQIATKGYEFPSDGIVFQDPKEFKCSGKAQTFSCVDSNSTKGSFKYTIKVVRSGTSDGPPPLDPTVMND